MEHLTRFKKGDFKRHLDECLFDWFGHFVSMLGFVICPDSKKGKVGPGADPEAV